MSVATHCTLPKESQQSHLSMLYGEPLSSEKSYLIDYTGLGGIEYLKDHRIAGKAIFPAAGFCMAGVVAHRLTRGTGNIGKPLILEKLKFRRSLSLSDYDAVELRLKFEQDCGEFTVHGDLDDGVQMPHAVGMFVDMNTSVPYDDDDSKFSNLFANCSETIDVSDFYQRLNQSGLNYGPYFKRIVKAYASRSSSEAVTRISCHPQLTDIRNQQARQITLLDSAFQSFAAALDPDKFGLYVPSRIRSLRLFNDLETNAWCHVHLRKTTHRAISGDIKIYSADKRLLMDIRGLSCLKIPQRKMVCSRTASDDQGVSPHYASGLHRQSSPNGLRN